MGRIHKKQYSTHIIGGQFAGGNLYLVQADGVSVVVSPGQAQPTNTYAMNQVSVAQNTDYITGGTFNGATLTLTYKSGEEVSINGDSPVLVQPGMVGQSIFAEQNCDTIVGGSIDGSTITLYKLCGDTVVINGYSNVPSYPDNPGFVVTTTTTTAAPTTTTTTTDPTTTTTTTSVENITTTTTYSGQVYKTVSKLNIWDQTGVLFGNYMNDENGLYCAIVDSLTNYSGSGSGGNALKYFGTFQVGTQMFTWQEQIYTSLNGFFILHNVEGYDNGLFLLVSIQNGMVNKIVEVGTRVFNYPDGSTQGYINPNSNYTCS